MATLEMQNITRGDNLHMLLEFNEDTDPVVAVDLSTYTDVVCEFREGPQQGSRLIVRKQLGDGIAVSGASNEILSVDVSANEMQAFDEGIYYFDIRFLIDAEVETLLAGQLTVTSNISAI